MTVSYELLFILTNYLLQVQLWMFDTMTMSMSMSHTPSIAFWHLSPNSAKFSYATEGALLISAQLSTDTVSALQKVWVLLY